MPFLKVYIALYAYEADTEEELTFKKNDVLYILEADDPHWWKAKLKTADPNHSHIGLVPSNYVEPLPSIGSVLGLYRYEAVTLELAFEQGDTLTLYEQDDPDWFLVGNGSQVGFVPKSYVEVSARREDHSQDHQAEDKGQSKEPISPDTPTVRTHGNKDSTKIWAVNKIDEKKKKRKGHLGLYNTLIVFGSDVDKSPVRKWLTKDVDNIRQEKCHVYLDLGGASPASLNFESRSKKEAEDIFNEIQKFRTLTQE
ncbi:cytoskeletal protein binding protein [Mortierella sp. NVP85]|nr:cytoskeletal protein binding protein [Mortierella sp. NVP85]